MKKNVEKAVRLRGFAEANGVAMEAGFAAGMNTIGDIGKFVTSNGDGTMDCKDYDFENETPKMVKKIHSLGRFVRIGFLILAAICMISFFMGEAKSYWGLSLAYIFLGLAMVSEAVVIAVGRLLRINEFVSFSKFEAAKNAVLNFYTDYKQIPNVRVLEHSERVDRGLNPEFVGAAGLASTLVVLGVARCFSGIVFAVVALFWLVTCCTVEPSRSKKVWQYLLVTSKPEEVHYKVAILALEEAIKWTENVTVKFTQEKFSKEDFVDKIGHMFEEEKCLKCKHFNECKTLWESLDGISAEIYVCEVRRIDEEGKA